MILTLMIPGVPISGNHAKVPTGNGRQVRSAESRAYDERIASIAKAAVVQSGWQMPDYVRVDVLLYNARSDRDNACKEIMDPLQGIAFAYDSRILDGYTRRIKDADGPRVIISVSAVDGRAYGFDAPRLRKPPKPVECDMLPSQSSAEARRRTAAALATNTAIAPAISFAERDKLLRRH